MAMECLEYETAFLPLTLFQGSTSTNDSEYLRVWPQVGFKGTRFRPFKAPTRLSLRVLYFLGVTSPRTV